MYTEDVGGKRPEHRDMNALWTGMAEIRVVLIDVRTPQDDLFERIRGALLCRWRPSTLPVRPPAGDRRVVFDCGSGMRSCRVAEARLAAAHDRVAPLEGGFAASKTAQSPLLAPIWRPVLPSP